MDGTLNRRLSVNVYNGEPPIYCFLRIDIEIVNVYLEKIISVNVPTKYSKSIIKKGIQKSKVKSQTQTI